MAKTTRYKVRIRESASVPSLLDMLRYEGATILDWTRVDDDFISVTISSVRYTPDRWHSFGIRPEVIGFG